MDILKVKYFSLLSIAFILSLIKNSAGLECYACENQDTNKDKCIKTSIQCEEHQDICFTEVKWGLPPYWTPYGDRMHYVFKGCDTRVSCEYQKQLNMPRCKRDWYDDWSCHECCSGDLCNYYVTLGAGTSTANIVLLMTSSLVTTFVLIKGYCA